MTSPRDTYRLFGVPDSEQLWRSVADAYECQIEPGHDPDATTPCIIEEWSALPGGSQFRSVEDILDWLIEDACDDAPEGFYDAVEHLQRSPQALAAAEALREVLVTGAQEYLIAQVRLGEHTITWDEQGEPLVNGEPMYVPSPGVGQEALDA